MRCFLGGPRLALTNAVFDYVELFDSRQPSYSSLGSPLCVTFGAMTDPTPYVHFPGTAREALTFYGDVFGCAVQLNSFKDFNRTDGPEMAIAHGGLVDGPVRLFGSDVAGDEAPFRCEGLMLSLLGTEKPSVLKEWFSRLSEGGTIIDQLQKRPWGAHDGQVIDRYGLHWLIGYEGDDAD